MAEKFKISKPGQQDRFVTEEQFKAEGFKGFTRSADQTPIAPPPPVDPKNLTPLEFAQTLPPSQAPIGDITPEKLAEEPDIVLPPPPPPVVDTGAETVADQTKADIIADIKRRQDIQKATETPEQKASFDLSKEIAKLIGDTAGKTAFEIQQQEELQAPLEKQLTSVNNQIDALVAEQQRLLTEQQGKPITMNSIIGAQAQIRAVLNSDIFTLTARANALLGNIALAEKQIERAVNAKFGPIEEEIAIKRAQRAAIADIVSKDERTQLDALEAADRAKELQIAEDKAREKEIQGIMLDAINAGITDQNILDSISAAKTVEEAAKLLAASAPDTNVSALQAKYPDAGIVATDTFEQAKAKLSGSLIFQQQTRLAGEPGGAGGEFPGLGLTEANIRTSKGNYFAANPEANEEDFDALSNEEKFAWFQGGPEGELTPIDEIVIFRNDIVDLKDSGISVKNSLGILIGEIGDALNESELNIFKEVYKDKLKEELPSEFKKTFSLRKTEIENWLKSINKLKE